MDVLNPIRLSVFCSNPRLKSVNQKILFGSYQWLGRAGLTRRKLSWSGNIQTAWDANVGRVRLRLTIIQPGAMGGLDSAGRALGRVSHLTTEDTWRLVTRVVSSVSHWVDARVTRVTDHTQDGLTAGYQLRM